MGLMRYSHSNMYIILVALVVGDDAETAEKFKDYIVDKHNEYRRMQGGSNINMLVWSDSLADHADKWSSNCRFEHEGKGFGENLAYNTGPDDMKNMEKAFEDWYNEIKTYNYAYKACGSSCHYTQLVWYATSEVGCAIERCPNLSAFGRYVKNAWYFACWYSPKGNMASEYPYNKGAPCSECLEGQGCDDGLCTGKGKGSGGGQGPCEDKNASCEMWADNGECESNPNYMSKNCMLSCNICQGAEPRKCEDKNPKCDKYAFSCESNKSWMQTNCKKTCGFC